MSELPQRERLPLPVVWLFGSLLAAAALLASSRGDVSRMTYGDGQIALYVASHLDAAPEDLHEVVAARGPSARYGRIGLPVTVWALSAGQTDVMMYVQPLVMIIAAGAAAVALTLLLPNGPPLAGLLVFAAPGFVLSLAGGYADALALTLGLWAVVLTVRGRWWPATGLLAVAMLTKENMGALMLALAGVQVWRRNPRAAAMLGTSVVPLLAWWLVVRGRFGYLPPQDPYFKVWAAAPFRGLLDSVVDPVSAGSAIAIGVHLTLAVIAITLFRRSLFAVLAVVASLQLVNAGRFAWEYVGDAFRISSAIQLFAFLAAVSAWRPGWADPSIVYRNESPVPERV